MALSGKLNSGLRPPQSVVAQMSGFIAKFDPRMAKFIRAVRAALRKRFPTAYELVYDNYNFFVIGYCSTPRASDCVVSMAAYAKGINLFFNYGAALPDPHKVLLGSGKQVRSIRLASASDLARPAVEELIVAALAIAETPMPESGPVQTIVKMVSAKQRPRR